MRKDKSVKIALDSGELNNNRTKMRPHTPNMEKILNQIFTEVTGAPNEPLWISETDLEYAYGQLKLSEETSKHCIFTITGGRLKDFVDSKKGSTVYQIYRQCSKKCRQNIES